MVKYEKGGSKVFLVDETVTHLETNGEFRYWKLFINLIFSFGSQLDKCMQNAYLI
jgi:hypothetical protein